jgi:WD40 repeat protein
MHIFDVRKNNKVLASIKAHNSRANDIKIGRKNLCYTCSEDETVRVWNLNDLSQPIAAKNPKCVTII